MKDVGSQSLHPFLMRKYGLNVAIIIDEAHSSQTGDAAKKLKRALADTEEILKEYAEMEDEDERNRKDDEDKLLDELAAQGMHKNLREIRALLLILIS